MALVTIVGYPCSGKSRLADALVKDLEARLSSPEYTGPKLDVVLVSDDTSHVSRAVYDSTYKWYSRPTAKCKLIIDSLAEKPGRGNLFTNVTRALGPDRIVICDSLNYIKGFRYQMYCAAREAQSRTVTVSSPNGRLIVLDVQVHVATPPKKCEEWHENRGECSYKPAT
jgi:protein KTI12